MQRWNRNTGSHVQEGDARRLCASAHQRDLREGPRATVRPATPKHGRQHGAGRTHRALREGCTNLTSKAREAKARMNGGTTSG